ncbi:unnamed protein product, partial [Ectocarpus sp. 8 AP-2014]
QFSRQIAGLSRYSQHTSLRKECYLCNRTENTPRRNKRAARVSMETDAQSGPLAPCTSRHRLAAPDQNRPGALTLVHQSRQSPNTTGRVPYRQDKKIHSKNIHGRKRTIQGKQHARVSLPSTAFAYRSGWGAETTRN